MKTIINIVFLQLLLAANFANASTDSELFGVWKDEKRGPFLSTIDFRKNGTLILCDGKWYQHKKTSVQKVYVHTFGIKHKENTDYFEQTGSIEGFFTRNYEKEPQVYNFVGGKLRITNVFGATKTYVRPNQDEIEAYNKSLTTFAKDIKPVNINSHMANFSIAADKEKKRNAWLLKVTSTGQSISNELSKHCKTLKSFTTMVGNTPPPDCEINLEISLNKKLTTVDEFVRMTSTFALLANRIELEKEYAKLENRKFTDQSIEKLLGDVEIKKGGGFNNEASWKKQIKNLKQKIASRQKPLLQKQSTKVKEAPNIAASTLTQPTSGRVITALHRGGYSYMEIDTNGKRHWVATPQMSIKTGDKISWEDESAMKNFKSPSLNRTFDEILFVKGAKIEQ